MTILPTKKPCSKPLDLHKRLTEAGALTGASLNKTKLQTSSCLYSTAVLKECLGILYPSY